MHRYPKDITKLPVDSTSLRAQSNLDHMLDHYKLGTCITPALPQHTTRR